MSTELEKLVPLLRRDLELSYERNHQAVHIHYTRDIELIAFKDCSLWVCKNRREKLAEWDAAIAVAATASMTVA